MAMGRKAKNRGSMLSITLCFGLSSMNRRNLTVRFVETLFLMLEKNEGKFSFSIHFHLATHVRSFAPDCPHKETDSEKNEGQDSYGEYFQLHAIPPNLITGHPGEFFPAKPQICEGKVINHYELTIHIYAPSPTSIEDSFGELQISNRWWHSNRVFDWWRKCEKSVPNMSVKSITLCLHW